MKINNYSEQLNKSLKKGSYKNKNLQKIFNSLKIKYLYVLDFIDDTPNPKPYFIALCSSLLKINEDFNDKIFLELFCKGMKPPSINNSIQKLLSIA